MMSFLETANWMNWGAALMVGFPLLVIFLGEIAFDLKRKGMVNTLTALDIFRNSTLFLIFLTILLRIVVGLPGDHIAVRLVDTALWITVINLALAIFNVFFFSGAEGTWRARVPKLLIDLGRLFIVLVWAAFVVSTIWGVDLKALLAALGVGSLVIGLALQDTLGNLFSGIAVVSARQFKVGDWIKVGDVEGQVRSVNWRSVTVATGTGDLATIPNGQIARERLRNFGADKGFNALYCEFKVPNVQPPQPVLELIVRTASETAGVLEDPKPLARIVSFDDADITYRAIIYVADYAKSGSARTELMANLWYALAREGIHLPPRPAVIPAHPHGAASGAPVPSASAIISAKLGALEIFQRARDKLDDVAGGCRIEVYRKGQSLIESGEASSRLFVITRGRTAAYLVTGAEKGLIEEFGPGELVLYKAFFRNAGCPFDVEAKSDVEAISMPVQSLEGLLAADPEHGTEIERLLSLREEAAGRTALKLEPDRMNGKGDTSRVDILKDMFRV